MIRMFMEVYRPHAAMFCSYSKGGAAMSFVPAFDPNRKVGRVPKGTKIFNYDQQIYFTLTLEEALMTANLLKGLLEGNEFTRNFEFRQGSYYIEVNEYGTSINIKHFDPQTNKPSTLIVNIKDGRYKVGIVDSTSGQNIFISLDIVELTSFIQYLQNTATFFTIQVALSKFESYKYTNRKQQNGSNQNQNYNQQQSTKTYGYNNSYTAPPASGNPYSPPPPNSHYNQGATQSSPQNANQQSKLFEPPPPPED